MGRGDRRVAGERQLAHRREDAHAVVGGGAGRLQDENGLGQVHLARGFFLHDFSGQIVGVEHDGGRIAV
jgi:hypothetical protein